MNQVRYQVAYTRFADEDLASAAQWFRQVNAPEVVDKFFRILEDSVLVIACQHSSRNPALISGILTVR